MYLLYLFFVPLILLLPEVPLLRLALFWEVFLLWILGISVIGIFIIMLTIPMGKPNKWFRIILIPDAPPGAILAGVRKQLMLIAYIKAPESAFAQLIIVIFFIKPPPVICHSLSFA